MKDDFLSVLAAISLVIVSVVLLPFVCFWLCYFGGWVASLTIGNVLTNGLNTLFQTTWFTKDMIPLCAGTLGWIGGYFRKTTNDYKEATGVIMRRNTKKGHR